MTEMTGAAKAAVLLVQLGKQTSAKVLAALRDTEVERVSGEIARLGEVESHVAESVLREFTELATAHEYAGQGGIELARELLETSLGRERADEIIGRLSATMQDVPFGFLQRADARQVLSFVQDEHPQTIALVLAHIPAHSASRILSGLAPDLQSDVAHRIAVMSRTAPELVREVEASLERKLSSFLQPTDVSTVGGLQPLVEIINRADRATERLILEGLEKRDKELADTVRSHMFIFEDIVSLDDKSIQLVLRGVEGADLAIALKGVSADVRDKVMRNMSERAAENLVDEIDTLGPVRLKSVEEAQGKVVQAIRALEESGEIVVRRGDDDQFVS